MDRKEILNTVVKQLRHNVDGLENTDIDPTRSMAEYGASSLDMVEVVSASMRDLDLRIPRTKLGGLKNINDLVDLFFNAKTQTA
jgi:acyl carrier protein